MASYILPPWAGKLVPAPVERLVVATFAHQGATADALAKLEGLAYSGAVTGPRPTFQISVVSRGLDQHVSFDTSFDIISPDDDATRWSLDLVIQLIAHSPSVSTGIQVPAIFAVTANTQPLRFVNNEAFSTAATPEFPGQVVSTFTGGSLRTDPTVTVRVVASDYILPGRAPLPLVASYLVCIFCTVQAWGPSPVSVLAPLSA